MTKFVIRTGDPLEENQENLRKHRELIILFESVRYCQVKHVDRIRYSELKKLSNNRLANLTDGKEVDFGGSFEAYILKFESTYNNHTELINRIRQRGRTFIIPNLRKIESVFSELKLTNIFDEKALVYQPISIEYDDSYFPFANNVGNLKEKVDMLDPPNPPTIYNARYYYRSGHPIFLKQQEEEKKHSLSLLDDFIDPDPFYKKTNFLYRDTSNKDLNYNEKKYSVFASDPWNISIMSPNDNDDMRLKEETVQQLLTIGKDIASKIPTRPFRLIVEYQRSPTNEE